MSDKMYPQKNAADEEQVKQARSREKRIRERELSDIRYLLQSPQGRRFLWKLMGRCKTFESIWEPSAKIHFNAGQQDLGHFIMAEIIEADENSLLQMMKESKQGEMTNV